MADTEEAVLSAALRVLDDHYEPGEAVLGDLSLVTEVRTCGPLVWFAGWWAHPEAVAQLTALWRAWDACA